MFPLIPATNVIMPSLTPTAWTHEHTKRTEGKTLKKKKTLSPNRADLATSFPHASHLQTPVHLQPSDQSSHHSPPHTWSPLFLSPFTFFAPLTFETTTTQNTLAFDAPSANQKPNCQPPRVQPSAAPPHVFTPPIPRNPPYTRSSSVSSPKPLPAHFVSSPSSIKNLPPARFLFVCTINHLLQTPFKASSTPGRTNSPHVPRAWACLSARGASLDSSCMFYRTHERISARTLSTRQRRSTTG